MKLTVLSGSPKGEMSVSLQYLKFIAKNSSDTEFEVFHIGEKIKQIAENSSEFEKIMDSIEKSDGVIWVFPVYHFLVPSQLKQFIEIAAESKRASVFQGKYSTSIITSIHFYDNLAENYIHSVSEELGMMYLKGYLAEMTDLKKSEKQQDIIHFGNQFLSAVKSKKIVPRKFAQLNRDIIEYNPETVKEEVKDSKYKIVMITDSSDKTGNLAKMREQFIAGCKNSIEVINLDEVETKGGCTGCCRCGYSNNCIYDDGLTEVIKSRLTEADGIVIASEIKSKYLGWKIKRMWDRSFVNGHTPFIKGKKIIYIISGELSTNSVLQQEIEARAGVGQNIVVDIISDELMGNEELTAHIKQCAEELISAVKEDRKFANNFHTVAGHKIFRDFIYLMKFVFRADHIYYKKNGLYDFSQKQIGMRILNFILLPLLKSEKIRAGFQKNMRSAMSQELRKIAE